MRSAPTLTKPTLAILRRVGAVDDRTVQQLDHALRKEQDRLRGCIHGEALLERISSVLEVLIAGTEMRWFGGEYVELPVTGERAAMLRITIDAQLRMLNKILPDLKSVEISADEQTTAAAWTILTAIGRAPNDPLPEAARVIEHEPEVLTFV